jgi:RNA polymerase sigma-70 factor, ECF subfamily
VTDACEVGDDRGDAQLVARARDGDLQAFGGLVAAHGPRVAGLVRRLGVPRDDVDEVAQEVFVRAWRAVGRFEGRARFSTWLYRIAFNEAQRRLDALARRPQAVLADERVPATGAAGGDPAAAAVTADLVERELRRLPAPLRAAVVLRDVEGLTTAEAAEVMGVREAAFKSRLHRGRTALRDALEPHVADA